MILFGFMYIATMIQIALSVRILTKKNTVNEMKLVLKLVYIGIIIVVLILVTTGTIIMLNDGISHDYMDPLYATIYLVLSALYCITLVFMLGTLNGLNQAGLKGEKASITK